MTNDIFRPIGEVASRDLASVESPVRSGHRAFAEVVSEPNANGAEPRDSTTPSLGHSTTSQKRGHGPVGKTRPLHSRDPGSNPGGSNEKCYSLLVTGYSWDLPGREEAAFRRVCIADRQESQGLSDRQPDTSNQ